MYIEGKNWLWGQEKKLQGHLKSFECITIIGCFNWLCIYIYKCR